MQYRRCVWALLAAGLVFAVRAAPSAGQPAPRRAAIMAYYTPYYPYAARYGVPAYSWYYYQPPVEPFPAYGISLPPFGFPMVQGNIDRPRTMAWREPSPAESAEALVAEVTRFRFEVTVPTPDATVLVEGVKTKQQGLHRVYMSPPLIVDQDYTYTVEVQWTDDTGTKRAEKTSFDFLLGQPTKHLQFPLKITK